MTNWARVIEGKVAIAAKANQEGMKPGKASVDAHIPQGQSRVGCSANHSHKITAGRHAWWCRSAMLGKVQNGFQASSSTKKIIRAFGKCAVITTTPTLGMRSGLVSRLNERAI